VAPKPRLADETERSAGELEIAAIPTGADRRKTISPASTTIEPRLIPSRTRSASVRVVVPAPCTVFIVDLGRPLDLLDRKSTYKLTGNICRGYSEILLRKL
jgi:hypothetical protein